MRSSSGYKKAQFFILSALTIVALMYLMGRWINASTIPDTSSTAVNSAPFIFNDIIEKTLQTVKLSTDCLELTYNMQEYSTFVKDFAAKNGYDLRYDYTIAPPCSGADKTSRTLVFNVTMSSSSMVVAKNFTSPWP
ncbi:hypothetical protein EPN87_00695 [archaeon]|nr:MAG: hypothetical protein EPN87_00695 [archaeon]